jgi:integrase
MQAYLGLRISEAVKVNISDIDFKNKQIRVYSPKTGNIDFLPLHDKICEASGQAELRLGSGWLQRYIIPKWIK